jgi:uncharacterized protein (TIGR03643 family)
MGQYQAEFFSVSESEFPARSTVLNDDEIDRVIEMDWEDRTSFDSIQEQFGLSEAQVIRLMRETLKRRSFNVWRARVSGRKTKHQARRSFSVSRFRCPTQYKRLNK